MIAGSLFTLFGMYYVYNRFGTLYMNNINSFATVVKISAWGNILNALCRGLLYGYMGYLMTTLSAPQDSCRSQSVVSLLRSGSSSTIEDDLYQAESLETIKVIIGQFLTNQIDREIQS